MFRLIIISILLAGTISTQAQSGPGKKDIRKYEKARDKIQAEKFDEAEALLISVLKTNPNFIKGHKELAILYLSTGAYRKAIQPLELLDSLEDYGDLRAGMSLVDAYEYEKMYDAAIARTLRLLDLEGLSGRERTAVRKRHDELVFRRNSYNHPLALNFERLPGQVNSEALEYLPALNAEGTLIIFTRRYRIGNQWSDEDLYYSKIDTAGSFSTASSFDAINTPVNEGAFCFSPDGRILIFASSDRKDCFGNFDLYISFLRKGMWTPPVNMGPEINSAHWESQPSISQDNRTIYFSSSRPGGSGGKDIWKVELMKDNSWSNPVNLGPEINTTGNETSPFIHPDDNSLYFRSDGHIGMGDFDIFLSRKDTQGEWGKPYNPGYPLNTAGSEGALFVDLSGSYAYYASDAHAPGEHLDIYRFELPQSLKPDPVSFVKLRVMDADVKIPLGARVSISALEHKAVSDIFQTDENGTLLKVIKTGQYAVSVEKEGYIIYSEHISIPDVRSLEDPHILDIYLQKLPDTADTIFRSEPVVLKNIFFASGSADLLPASDTELENLAAFLVKNGSIGIEIIGHTDNIGDPDDNLKLSEKRARAVRDHLVDIGIDAERVVYRGMGESAPVASNDTEEGRQLNRRTEFIIIEN